jgi:serine/threonine-protein kinase
MGGDSYIGRYRIEEHIATGGMGEIYRATPADGIPKPVALKVIRPEVDADPSLRSMFEAEARVALALSHANVVQTFEVERNQGRLFLAMEHVDGLDLSKLLRTVTRALCQPLPWRHVLLIVCDALEGLDYAHRSRGADGCSLGIVHRDISPSNILVSCEGEVKIADFGVAVSTRAAARRERRCTRRRLLDGRGAVRDADRPPALHGLGRRDHPRRARG